MLYLLARWPQRRQGVVRLADQCEGRSRDHRLVRRKKSRRRKGCYCAVEQGRIRGRDLRANRFLSGLSGLAQECRRDCEGAATVLLGRKQSGLKCVSHCARTQSRPLQNPAIRSGISEG